METLILKALQGLKYNLTIPHDWLVKRVFVTIIKTRSDSSPQIKGFEVMGITKR